MGINKSIGKPSPKITRKCKIIIIATWSDGDLGQTRRKLLYVGILNMR